MASTWSYLDVFDVTSVNLKQNYKGLRPTYAHVSLLNSSKLHEKKTPKKQKTQWH